MFPQFDNFLSVVPYDLFFFMPQPAVNAARVVALRKGTDLGKVRNVVRIAALPSH